jgi:hypothetical protein
MRSALRVLLAVALVMSLLGIGFAGGLAMSPREELRGVELVVTDLTGGAQKSQAVPRGFTGVIAVGAGVACLVQQHPSVVDVRCRHGDQWSSVVMRCEQYEIGAFVRRYGMTFGASNGSSMTEVELACRY